MRPRRSPQAPAQGIVAQQFKQCGGEPRRLARRHQQAGFACHHHLAATRHIGRHQRHGTGRAFEQRTRNALALAARQHHHTGGLIQRQHIAALAKEFHIAGRAPFRQLGLIHAFRVAGVRRTSKQKAHSRQLGPHLPRSRDKIRHTLGMQQARHHQHHGRTQRRHAGPLLRFRHPQGRKTRHINPVPRDHLRPAMRQHPVCGQGGAVVRVLEDHFAAPQCQPVQHQHQRADQARPRGLGQQREAQPGHRIHHAAHPGETRRE